MSVVQVSVYVFVRMRVFGRRGSAYRAWQTASGKKLFLSLVVFLRMLLRGGVGRVHVRSEWREDFRERTDAFTGATLDFALF